MEFCNGNLFCNSNKSNNNSVSCDCVKLRPIWLQSIADLAKAAETTTSHMGRDSQRQTDRARDLSALKLSYISHSFVNCPKVAPFRVEILIEIRHQLCELSVRGGHQASQQINFTVSVSLPLFLSLSFYIIYMTWPMATNNFCNWPATG